MYQKTPDMETNKAMKPVIIITYAIRQPLKKQEMHRQMQTTKEINNCNQQMQKKPEIN
jgi:hypothetical protein